MSERDRRQAERECRGKADHALREGDWYEAYLWTKSWISRGGARLVEPWLLYSASALQQGKPKTAVHSCDLGLSSWLEGAVPRSIVYFMRGEVIRRHLKDPKTALPDLRTASESGPEWLRPDAAEALDRCTTEAARSRKRKASVDSAPSYDPGTDPRFVPNTLNPRYDLEREPPPIWKTVVVVLASPDPRTGPRRGPKLD